MRVLVTGGGGYIGSVAIERLIAGGHDVVALDSFYRGHKSAVHPDAGIITCDLRNAGETLRAVDQSKAEAAEEKRDAMRDVAEEKCDALSGDAKTACMNQAKAKHGK